MTVRFVLAAALCIGVAGAGESRGEDAPAAPPAKMGYVLRAGEGEVLHLGPPTGGRIVTKIDPAKTGFSHMAMGMQHLEGEIPLHLHEHEEELLFVHEGHGMATLGDETVAVEAGTTIYVPPGTWHGVKNTGESPAQVLWLVTPGEGEATYLEKFFRAIGAPPGEEVKALTPEQMGQIMEKHGMQGRFD